MPIAETVGVWSSRVKEDSSEISYAAFGGSQVFSVQKLRKRLGKDICLSAATSLTFGDGKQWHWVHCLHKGQPGHEWNGRCHNVDKDFRRQWAMKGQEGKDFQEGFRL